MKLTLDIGEILTLAWDNPIFTGGLLLLFTPPVFRVLVFFYPLLISTALCAVALISVGQQVEAAREREIAGWNAKVVDGDGLSARLVSATRGHNEAPKEDDWPKLAQFERLGSALTDETEIRTFRSGTHKNEWLTPADKGLEYTEDQYLFDRRQIEAFRAYERSFRPKVTADADMPTAPVWNASVMAGTSPAPPTEMSAPDDNTNNNRAGPAVTTIPPMVLYNLKTGGTGRAAIGTSGAGELSSSAQGEGAQTTISEWRNQAIVAKGLTGGGFDSFSRNVNVLESSRSSKQRGTEPSPSLLKQPRSKNETVLLAKASAAETPVYPFAAMMDLNNSNAAEKNAPNNAPENLNKSNAAEKNTALRGSGKPNHRWEGEHAGFPEMSFQGQENDRSRSKSPLAPRSPVINFSSVASTEKRSEESLRASAEKASCNIKNVVQECPVNMFRAGGSPAKRAKVSLRKASSYNSTLRYGNAVIYNADSIR